jgi:PAS domain S-box-containing protein
MSQDDATLNLLILAEYAENTEPLIHQLQQAGFQPQWQLAQDEAQYLMCLSSQLDVVLIDHPQLSVARALQLRDERRLDVPCIVVGSAAHEAEVSQDLDTRVVDYLLKDRLHRLGQVVKRAVDERRLRAEKQHAEAALRESEEKFTAIFHDSLDVILIVNSETGYILNINNAVQRVLGYKPEALIGQHFSTLFGSQASKSKMLMPLDAFSAVFEASTFLRADGSLCTMDVTATMIPWEKGAAILATLRDVTESRQAREALLRVELMKEELTRERELVQLKENFISMVSHEFRTPLAVIMTSAEMLEYYFDRLTPQKRVEQLHKIKAQADEMTELLNDVLFISRAKAGKLRFQPSVTNLATFCQDMIEHVKLRSDYQPHNIVFRQVGDVSAVYADEKLLQHIVTNLLDNALKYSAHASEVLLEVRAEAERVIIRVVDHGMGIPPEAHPYLFEPFFRADNASSISGTGLGLAIVKNSVEIHQGTITFESPPGVGTTFVVTLPTLEKPIPE